MKLRLDNKPFIGILAFIVVLFTMPLGHTLMVLIEIIFGHTYQIQGAAAVGTIGALLLWIGARNLSESKATWYGLFSGVLLWTGWVEFSFVWSAHHLGLQPLMENEEVVTKPEYLIMPSSIGLLLATVLYFLFNGNTRCNFFTWIQRNLRLKIRQEFNGKQRNFAIITALETIYVLWFFYIVLLLVYDNKILGDHHPGTYAVFAGSLIWSLYLLIRLIKFTKIAPAVRYAIPAVIIFWNCIEILGRWNFFKEIWIDPMNHALELVLIFIAFVAVTILTILTPKSHDTV
jgi:hypothetical protein